MRDDQQSFPFGRALLTLVAGGLIGGAGTLFVGFFSLVALNGFSEREALPVLALLGGAQLFAGLVLLALFA